MALKIQNTQNISENANIRMIAYGDSGVGKTVFATGFPKTFVIASEDGLLSAAGRDVDYVKLDSWSEMESIYLYLLKDESRKKYQTVVIDSLTDLQQRCLTFVLESNGRTLPEQRDWGQMLEVMRRFLRQMVDLPYNVIFVCLAGTERDELTGIVRERPAISGRLAVEAPAYVDIVMHMTVEQTRKGGEVEVNRFGIFQPDARSVAKDRSGRLPTVMKEPTASKVLAKVRGEERPTRKTTTSPRTRRS